MRSLVVVVAHPLVEVCLQCLDGLIEFLAECHLVKLLQNRLVEAFADCVGLRAFRLGLGVVDVVDGQVQFVGVLFGPAAVFGSAVSEDAQHASATFRLSCRQRLGTHPRAPPAQRRRKLGAGLG